MGRGTGDGVRRVCRVRAAATAPEHASRRALRGVPARLPAALARRGRLPPYVEHAARLVKEASRAGRQR